jgi:putative ABC transport system permease protein
MSLTASFRQDLRWSQHMMRRNLALTAAVVLSLGMTIGANTATFSVLNAFLLRPLSIQDADRVVRVRENLAAPDKAPSLRSLTAANYGAWRAHQRVFTDIAAATGTSLTLTGSGEPERFSAALISANFFPLLGIQPLLGRNIAAEEDRPGQNQVVILSFDVWQQRFGGDPAIIGQLIRLNGERYTVIGVMNRGFHHPYEADMWVPLAYHEDPTAAAVDQEYYAPARLKPGVTLEQARQQMNDLVKHLREDNPRPNAPKSADLSPIRHELVGDLDKLLYLMVAASAFVLLIACVNVSNLLLAQGLKQSAEVAVRVALGATRGRLIRQILTYSLLLAMLGAVLGILLASWSMKPLVALSPAYALGEFDIEPRLDLPTLGFTLIASLVVGFLFGMMPALRMSRTSISSTLQEGGRARTLGKAGRRLLSALVVAEVALSLVLLVGAGLILRSFQRLQAENRGFDMHNVLSFTVPLPDFKFPNRLQKVAFIKKSLDRLHAVPGAEGVGGATTQPLYTGTYTTSFNVEGNLVTTDRGYHVVHNRIVTPGYLESLRVPLLAGRYINDHDTPDSPWVVVVSKSLADRYWPGQSAIGKRVKRGRFDSTRPWLTVVGVVGSIKETHDELIDTDDAWYVPYSQPIFDDIARMTFMVRMPSNAAAVAPAVREAIHLADKDEPIYSMMTMEERFAQRTTPERFSTVIYTSLGCLGLLLAAIGIYGVLSFSVNQRLREIGIRTAMGAQPRQLRALVMTSAMRLTAAGLVLGVIGALVLTKLLSSQLYQVSPHDPVALVVALICLAVIAFLSAYLPARRASRIDAVKALRFE